ncbi:N-acetylmuramoyl-L-alanine amidase [uncultured Arthrobacter sp.]|uniref:peptidoglycan recognition protein family protein n=1 Tax=uncultured Arthrobacter sp. TaxID=114050 RepID=UPI0025F3E3E7|nr:N-acetylmuramoyl-L-alanine amidase [uncultured Arthrobacter sp.]
MPTYLEENPPRIRQFRQPRREKPSGVIVIHTAESALDIIGDDTGAEGVAAFIANRSTYGSYHTIVDSNSRVRLVPFDAEAYGDGTGSNYHAIHISFACKAAGWPGMSAERRSAMVRQGAEAAAEAATWLRDTHGITVPHGRITRAQSEVRVPGFISHGERDPGRRSDPGAAFPWNEFLTEYQRLMVRPLLRTRLTARVHELVEQKKRIAATLKRLRARRDAL